MDECPECQHPRTADRDPWGPLLRLFGRVVRARCWVQVQASEWGGDVCGCAYVWHAS